MVIGESDIRAPLHTTRCLLIATQPDRQPTMSSHSSILSYRIGTLTQGINGCLERHRRHRISIQKHTARTTVAEPRLRRLKIKSREGLKHRNQPIVPCVGRDTRVPFAEAAQALEARIDPVNRTDATL